jgi:predicted nuclease with TOPRIM domain
LIRYSNFGFVSNFEIWISSFFRNRRLLKARKDGILLDAMKNRIGVLILVVVCVGLGIGLIGVKRQADTEKAKDIVSIQSFSNNLNVARNELVETKQVNDELRKDVDNEKKNYSELTNNFSQVSANLAQTEASLRTSEQEIAKRDVRIVDLETQNKALDQRAQDLSLEITNLGANIDATQKKLLASEGDKSLLEKELKRMVAEKAELERQFNDLTVLRAQVAKLRDEQIIARRMDWTARGVYAAAEQKGAQRLISGLVAPSQAKAPKANYDLNVEVTSDGSVRVIPPLTNGPAATATSPSAQ